jgi:transcriptional antiterminator NusG
LERLNDVALGITLYVWKKGGKRARIIRAMSYYAIQVKTRSEEKYIRLFRALHPEITLPLHFPRRQMDLRRKGVIRKSVRAIFPGYIFIELEEEDDILNYHWSFRRTDGFFRFLRSNQNISPLAGQDLELVLHFIKAGPVTGKSTAYLDENARIVVTEGPLMGLEGRIVKVDKRKGRAKIKLDLYDDSFSLDLAIEIIGTLERRQGGV